MIIETHCHLDYLKKNPLDEVFEKSKQAGVEKIVTIAVEPDNYDDVLKLAEEHEQVYFTQGTHPHDAKVMTDEAYEVIRSRSSHPKMVAVGEIGLDYHYDNSPREIQKEVFRKQLKLACELNKPVVIHSREAEEDTMAIMGEYADSLHRKGVIHSFTSTQELADFALSKGFYIGFNGIITFKSAKEVRGVLEQVPLDRILLETDAPFLTPVPHRGKENAPFYLPHIAEKVAEVKNVPVDQVINQCNSNSKKLFNF
jgi:TatD DNase family protein